MNLFIFLKKHKMSMRKLAKLSGVTEATMSNIVNGKTSASLKVAIKIMFFTQGEISYLDLLSQKDYEEAKQFLDAYGIKMDGKEKDA